MFLWDGGMQGSELGDGEVDEACFGVDRFNSDVSC